ncbi:MAG: 50S ribosomal protein L21 [Patescibacteria group bacterium]|nr:50S ribosomal protein L21 [Patescibacteria group bacterium]MDE1945944.1 50S ribosomal protein L21 [Patescibacteria group bacterium]
MEFAVIKTGGKQYKVAKGDSIKIEKLSGASKAGDKVVFDQVLLVDNGKDTSIGTPYIKGATVEGTVEAAGRLPKIMVMHYKQKSRYFKKNGHRQPYLKVKITAIK